MRLPYHTLNKLIQLCRLIYRLDCKLLKMVDVVALCKWVELGLKSESEDESLCVVSQQSESIFWLFDLAVLWLPQAPNLSNFLVKLVKMAS